MPGAPGVDLFDGRGRGQLAVIWPPAYVLDMLVTARRFGVPFERAWPDAVAGAVGVSDEPAEWAAAFEWAREEWAAAFAGTPAPSTSRALATLAEDLELEDNRATRRCENDNCKGWIPVDRDPRARFCSDKCKRQANYRLERERDRRRAHRPPEYVPLGPPAPDFEIGRRAVLQLAEWTHP